jgi:hypothetical protein
MKLIDNAGYCSPYEKFSYGIVVKCNLIDKFCCVGLWVHFGAYLVDVL